MNTVNMLIAALLFFSANSAFAHGGGVDSNGCHSKNDVRHCHGVNSGKYIPEKETRRVEKLHGTTCKSPDAEGRYPRVDFYGKRCKRR